VVVGAHYDSVWGCPGANNNASGVAALLELARAFRAVKQSRTLRFVAFANEEPPYFQTTNMGSRVYARHYDRMARAGGGVENVIQELLILSPLKRWTVLDSPFPELAVESLTRSKPHAEVEWLTPDFETRSAQFILSQTQPFHDKNDC